MLGDVLFKLGKPDESIANFRQALAADDKLAEARAGIGRALIQMKRYSEAAAEMERAIQSDGRLASLHLYLSQAYRALGRPDDAKREVEVFNRLNAERAAARDKDVERKYSE
jgi:tetratricopeptide (TPR) repeat protein